MQLSVKNVDEEIFKEFKAESVKENLPLGKAMSLAMQYWISRQTKKAKYSLLDFKATDWGPGSEKASIESDNILYG
ncbi:hypothetical protein HY837_03060 [archaeon]|nr:hypothetical protein [archaeon]